MALMLRMTRETETTYHAEYYVRGRRRSMTTAITTAPTTLQQQWADTVRQCATGRRAAANVARYVHERSLNLQVADLPCCLTHCILLVLCYRLAQEWRSDRQHLFGASARGNPLHGLVVKLLSV